VSCCAGVLKLAILMKTALPFLNAKKEQCKDKENLIM